MRRVLSRRLLSIVAVVFAQVAMSAAHGADGPVTAGLYHEGVKAYFSGDAAKAAEVLGSATQAGSNDPRAYFFLGLAQNRLRKGKDAEASYRRGAELESQSYNNFYNVSAALERVQGDERRVLETYRAAGRKQALAAVEKVRMERFRRFNPEEAVAGPANPSDGQAAPSATVGGVLSTPPAASTPAATAPATSDNPFGAPAAPAAQPPGAQPPAAQPPAAQPPAAQPPSANPFGT